MSVELKHAISTALAPSSSIGTSPRRDDPRPAARIMIATPAYDSTLHWRCVESLMIATVVCLGVRPVVELELAIEAQMTLVQFARNCLAQRFLDDPTYTHILWLDADVGFDPRAILRLLSHQKDVVGGVYPTKTSPSWFPFEPTGLRRDGLLEAAVMPTGFLLVSRRAMQAVAETVPWYVHHHRGRRIRTRHIFDLELVERNGEPVVLGEDVVLCQRLRKLGFDIWADPDIGFRHCGMHEWGGLLSLEMQKWAAAGVPGWSDDGVPAPAPIEPEASGRSAAA